MESRWIAAVVAAVVVVILAAVLTTGGFLFIHHQRSAATQRALFLRARQAQMQAQRAAALQEESADGPGSRRMELDSLENDSGTVRSILDGLEIRIELVTRSNEGMMVSVRIEKPLGRRYLVDGIENSCILYANGRPWALLKRYPGREDARQILPEDLGSISAQFGDIPLSPEGAELKVEWINYNPRTRTAERLQSPPVSAGALLEAG